MNEKLSLLYGYLSDFALKIVKKHSVPKWLVFLQDVLAVFFTFILAYILRYNFVISDFELVRAIHHSLLTVSLYALCFLIFHSYSGMIRHTTIIDIFYVLEATTLAFLLLISMTFAARSLGWIKNFSIPISILIIHYMLINVVLFAVRIIIKTFFHLITSSHTKKIRVLIFGAGAMGVIVKRVLLSDVKGYYHVVGFLDNNKSLQGKKLNGIPVFSPKVLTEEFLKRQKIETMIFAIKDISQSKKSEIIRSTLELGLEVLDTPAVDNWLNGELQMRQIEKVKVEDLLGREPINLNIKKIGIGLSNKTVLVTGAAGSIGSEIVRQLTRFNIKLLVLVDQAETPMFHIENEIRLLKFICPIKVILADVTCSEKMDSIFREFRPEIVFHAAAYKHVPLMEENPHEAIRVNIGGTKLITRLSMAYEVKKFVMISTDKAVNPTNIMGASKRLCEMIVQLKSQKLGNKTQFIITRFGNVLGSNGSVIPVFSRQIAAGGPVTVTHPDITRYFMTIPEACQLVLEAGFMGHGGEIFVFDMGKPIKIADLAAQMIRLSGFIPDKDIKIEYTGLRPGEKLYEELLADEETVKPTHHAKIKIANVKKLVAPGMLLQVENLLQNLYSLTNQEVSDIFRELVPEYNCSNNYFLDHQHTMNLKHEQLPTSNSMESPYIALSQMTNPNNNHTIIHS